MIKSSEYFTYNGISSKDKHIICVNVNESGMLTESFLPTRNIKEVSIRGRRKPYFQEVEYQPLTFTMSLTLENGYLWEDNILKDIVNWLCTDYYQPLTFENDLRIFYCMSVESSEIVHNCLKSGYVSLTMRCDSPYAYSPEYILPSGNEVIEVNGSKDISIEDKGDIDCYPEIWIEKTSDENEKIEIINSTNGSNIIFQEGEKAQGNITFSGTVYDGESIIIENDIYEYDTGDGEVSFNRIDVDVSSDSTYAESELIFSNSYTQDSLTESQTNIIEGTKATGSFVLNSIPKVNDYIKIGNETYTFEKGYYSLKVSNHNLNSTDSKNYVLFKENDDNFSTPLIVIVDGNSYFHLNKQLNFNTIYPADGSYANIGTKYNVYKELGTVLNTSINDGDYENFINYSSIFNSFGNSYEVGDVIQILDNTLQIMYTVKITNISSDKITFSPALPFNVKSKNISIRLYHNESKSITIEDNEIKTNNNCSIPVTDITDSYKPSLNDIIFKLYETIFVYSGIVTIDSTNNNQLNFITKEKGAKYNSVVTTAYITDTNSKFLNPTLIGGSDDTTTITNYTKITQNHSNIVEDGETITIGDMNFEFDDDGVYSSVNIPVSIAGEITKANNTFILNTNPYLNDTITINKQTYIFKGDITESQLFVPNHGINPNILSLVNLTDIIIIYNNNKKAFRLGQIINKDNILERYFNLDSDGYFTTFQSTPNIDRDYPVMPILEQDIQDIFTISTFKTDRKFSKINDGMIDDTSEIIVDFLGGLSGSSGKKIVYLLNNVPIGVNLNNIIPKVGDVLFVTYQATSIKIKPYFYTILDVQTQISESSSNTKSVSITMTLDNDIPLEYNNSNIMKMYFTFYDKLKTLTVDSFKFTNPNQVKIENSKSNTLKNLINAINGETTSSGTSYSEGTISQTDTLTTTQYYPTSSTTDTNMYMKLEAIKSGYDGNNIITTSSMADTNNKFNNNTLIGGKSCDTFVASNLLAKTINSNLDSDSVIQEVDVITNSGNNSINIKLNSDLIVKNVALINKTRYNRMINNYNLTLQDIIINKKQEVITNISNCILSSDDINFHLTYFYNDTTVILLDYPNINNIIKQDFVVSSYIPAVNTTLHAYILTDTLPILDDTIKTNVKVSADSDVKVGDVMSLYMGKTQIVNNISSTSGKISYYLVKSIDSNGIITFDKTIDVQNYTDYYGIFYKKLSDVTTLDNNNSDYRVHVKAKIAGSDGNNILTTSNCENAKWNTAYNNGYTLWGGKDPSMQSCINALKQSINSLYLYKTDYIDTDLLNVVKEDIKVIGIKTTDSINKDNVKYLQVLNNNHLDFLNFEQYEVYKNKVKENTTLFNINDIFNTYIEYENVNSWGVYNDNKIKCFNPLDRNFYNNLLKVKEINKNTNVANLDKIQTLLKNNVNNLGFIIEAKIKDITTNNTVLLVKEFNLSNVSFANMLYSSDVYLDTSSTGISTGNMEILDVKIFFKVPYIIKITDKNVSRNYSVIDSNDPNVIKVQWSEIGEIGNVNISSTCYNATWDDTTMYGGRNQLIVGEDIYVNNDRQEIVSSLPNTYRHNVHNGQWLSLKANSMNRITINGDCRLRFRYKFKYLN